MVFTFFISHKVFEILFKEAVVESDAGIIMVHEWSRFILRCYQRLQEAIQSSFNPSVTLWFKSQLLCMTEGL
jgi:hypothetical protein